MALLCEAYWYPLYSYARRIGNSPEQAEDLTQEYFARLLKNELLCGVTREGGKFRSFLLTTFKCFLANEWHRERAEKRGNGRPPISIDDEAEVRYVRELVTQVTPETAFDRQWALTILDRVIASLKADYIARGKADLFQALSGCLPGAHDETCYRAASTWLGMSETAVRMAAHRMRQRYGDLLRAEVAATVGAPEHIDTEIRELIKALSAR